MPLKRFGPEFQVNKVTTNDQYESSIATLTDGRFIVTYTHNSDAAGTDTDILAQIVNANGTLSGGTLVIDVPSGRQQDSAVAARLDGGFTTVWQDFGTVTGSPSPDPDIYAAITTSAGVTGAPIPIATFSRFLRDPGIAMLADGREVIVFAASITATLSDDIYLNVLNPNGTLLAPATSAVAVENNSSEQDEPAIAAIGNNALVVYTDATGGSSGADIHIQGRIFNGASNTLLTSFQIANHGVQLFDPDVAAISGGRYVVVFHDIANVYARIYNPALNALGPEIVIATGGNDTNQYISPHVTGTADGGFVVAYAFKGQPSLDPSSYAVHERQFDTQGNPVGPDIVVNSFTNGVQLFEDIGVSGANVLVTWDDQGPRTTDPSASGVRAQILSSFQTPHHDFNIDLNSDLLFQDANGQTVLWEMGPSGQKANLFVGTINPAYAIQDVADFNADGKSDILFRHANGDTLLWTMNGNVNTAQASIGTLNPNYVIQGAADFNGDSRSDILFRGTAAGDTVLWTMDGNVNTGQFSLGTLNSNYKIQTLADFNGDGKADILFRGASGGDAIIWTMDGAVNTGQFGIGTINLSYHVAGTGDFNGDGNSDILWHGDNGDYILWTMSGGVNTGQFSIGPINPVYQAADIEDFNGDGKADILFRPPSGDSVVWFMNGATNIGQADLGPINNAFQVVQHHYDIV